MSHGDHIVEELVKFLLNKNAVVIATDTVYGILALEEELIIRAKKRFSPDKKTVRFIHNKSQIPLEIPEDLHKLLDHYWPGELTIVYGGVGYRCPNNHYILEALKKLQQPIFSSSANISNQPTATTINEAKEIFKNCEISVQFIEAPKQTTNSGKASTVYDYDNRKILREGSIKKEDIFKFIPE